MTKRIYEAGVDTQPLFRVEAADDGYFAVRDAAPRFAFWGLTVLQAVDCAIRAIGAHRIAAQAEASDAPKPQGDTQ